MLAIVVLLPLFRLIPYTTHNIYVACNMPVADSLKWSREPHTLCVCVCVVVSLGPCIIECVP